MAHDFLKTLTYSDEELDIKVVSYPKHPDISIDLWVGAEIVELDKEDVESLIRVLRKVKKEMT